MSMAVKKLNSIINNGILINDELVTLRRTIKEGLEKVVESNNELNPEYRKKKMAVGEWRKVDPYQEEQWKPLVKSDDLTTILKKLDAL